MKRCLKAFNFMVEKRLYSSVGDMKRANELDDQIGKHIAHCKSCWDLVEKLQPSILRKVVESRREGWVILRYRLAGFFSKISSIISRVTVRVAIIRKPILVGVSMAFVAFAAIFLYKTLSPKEPDILCASIDLLVGSVEAKEDSSGLKFDQQTSENVCKIAWSGLEKRRILYVPSDRDTERAVIDYKGLSVSSADSLLKSIIDLETSKNGSPFVCLVNFHNPIELFSEIADCDTTITLVKNTYLDMRLCVYHVEGYDSLVKLKLLIVGDAEGLREVQEMALYRELLFLLDDLREDQKRQKSKDVAYSERLEYFNHAVQKVISNDVND